MKYLSVDLETTCISPKYEDAILMAAFVVEDSDVSCPLDELPSLTVLVRPENPDSCWSPMAMAMNSWILLALEMSTKPVSSREYTKQLVQNDIMFERAVHALSNYKVVDGPTGLSEAVIAFLDKFFGVGKKVTLAGKNVASFDLQFFPKRIADRCHHRVIDPAMMFVDWRKDTMPPNTSECLKRAGVDMPGTAHDALADALAVIALLRTTYPK